MISAPRIELPANGTAPCPACGQHAAGPPGIGRANGGRNVAALNALVRVQLKGGVQPDCFEAQLAAAAGVVEAWRLAGDSDFEVRLSCRSLADLDAVVAQLRDAGGITSTTLVLHRVRLDA
jgi:DNA-binding Lrp family transcriptional regulator